MVSNHRYDLPLLARETANYLLPIIRIDVDLPLFEVNLAAVIYDNNHTVNNHKFLHFQRFSNKYVA